MVVVSMYKVFKRTMDFLLALILLIILSPIMLIVMIAIRLESKGSPIFKQLRTGYKGKDFYCLKFRSMSINNDVHDFSKGDQVTKVGKFIRKTSLDELPQLVNILKGDMSFIGPRPWINDYTQYFTKTQKRRFEVRPGMTGYAQCNGRNNIGIKEKIKLDIEYVDNISLKMDIGIIFKSVICVLKSEGYTSNKSTIKDELEELKSQV